MAQHVMDTQTGCDPTLLVCQERNLSGNRFTVSLGKGNIFPLSQLASLKELEVVVNSNMHAPRWVITMITHSARTLPAVHPGMTILWGEGGGGLVPSHFFG